MDWCMWQFKMMIDDRIYWVCSCRHKNQIGLDFYFNSMVLIIWKLKSNSYYVQFEMYNRKRHVLVHTPFNTSPVVALFSHFNQFWDDFFFLKKRTARMAPKRRFCKRLSTWKIVSGFHIWSKAIVIMHTKYLCGSLPICKKSAHLCNSLSWPWVCIWRDCMLLKGLWTLHRYYYFLKFQRAGTTVSCSCAHFRSGLQRVYVKLLLI